MTTPEIDRRIMAIGVHYQREELARHTRPPALSCSTHYVGVGSPPSDVAEYGIKCQQCAALIYDDRLHVPLKSGFVAVREGYSVKLKVFRFVRTHL
jgi:hypothetical protein